VNRREELDAIFKNIDENNRKLIGPLIEEVIFLEEQMKILKILPFIRVHPKNDSKQEVTKAAKQYKEFSQSYANHIRILAAMLSKNDTPEEDPVKLFLESRRG
jgi:hypothetical protein